MPGESKLDCLQIGLYIRNVAITKPGGPYCGRPCNFHLRVGRTRIGISAGNVPRLLVFHINFLSTVLSKNTPDRSENQFSTYDVINCFPLTSNAEEIRFLIENQCNSNFMIYNTGWRCNPFAIDLIYYLVIFIATLYSIIMY